MAGPLLVAGLGLLFSFSLGLNLGLSLGHLGLSIGFSQEPSLGFSPYSSPHSSQYSSQLFSQGQELSPEFRCRTLARAGCPQITLKWLGETQTAQRDQEAQKRSKSCAGSLLNAIGRLPSSRLRAAGRTVSTSTTSYP